MRSGQANAHKGTYGMWQKSETGRVNGINGNVDLNVCYQDFPTTIKALGKNGFPKNTQSATVKEMWRVYIDFDKEQDAKSIKNALDSPRVKVKKVLITSG